MTPPATPPRGRRAVAIGLLTAMLLLAGCSTGGGNSLQAHSATPTEAPTPATPAEQTGSDSTPAPTRTQTQTPTPTPTETPTPSPPDSLSEAYSQSFLSNRSENQRVFLRKSLHDGIVFRNASEGEALFLSYSVATTDGYKKKLHTLVDNYRETIAESYRTDGRQPWTPRTLVLTGVRDGTPLALAEIPRWWVLDAEFGNLTQVELRTRVLASTDFVGRTEASGNESVSRLAGTIVKETNVSLTDVHRVGRTWYVSYTSTNETRREFVRKALHLTYIYGLSEKSGWDTDAVEVALVRNGSVTVAYRIPDEVAERFYEGELTNREVLARLAETRVRLSELTPE